MKYIRLLLLPFSALYSLIIRMRHFLYDKGILKSREFDFPVICVGNLSLGGTGKSPMIEFLMRQLKENYQIATLSRGYKRKTSGFVELRSESLAADVGDEPLQFKTNFPNQIIAVDESRVNGIEQLKKIYPRLDAVLLDDAFQHRKVKAGFNILLTTFDNLYFDDFLLPAGNLRDSVVAAKRADIIIVTKCPSKLSEKQRNEIQNRLKPKKHQQVFFSKINYDDNIYSLKKEISLSEIDDFILVTGIAKPKPLIDYLNKINTNFEHQKFPDHHHFTENEIEDIKNKKKKILTTTKDFMRLKSYFKDGELYHLPIKSDFFEQEKEIMKSITEFMNSFLASNQ
ncbi:MAG: tetraacyldisaccharide 4'-kinase [Psychroflexus halocasei]|uniref:tetraacyldisaccharide 4'-kinase n=1 Tax=Psychroflexus sp. S27 TaxID=1982757 RepID=UPI000C2A8DBA|nr:tetraacyldisaccharide 4'-kinase [Psychroflexus sp. S27]PJX24447.1 tetraacyldisaccharide 4'-kinase [Psychroflexus sp. S27]